MSGGKRYRITADASEAVREFDRAGAAGARMAARIRGEAQSVPPALRALDAAVGEAKTSIEGAAGNAGSLGSVLTAMGPAGLAAAAGIGAAAAAATALYAASRETVNELNDLYASAERIGVTTDSLQELRFGMTQLGYDARQVDASMLRLGQTLGKLGTEQGREAVQQLRRLGLTDEQIAGFHSVEEALPAIADGMARLATETERQAIAQALGVTEMLPVLRSGAAAIDGMRESARAAGVVIDEQLVEAGWNLDGAWAAASARLDVQFKQALVDLAPLMIDFVNALADAASFVAQIADGFREVEARSTRGLERRLEELRAPVNETTVPGLATFGASERPAVIARLEQERAAERLRVERELADRRGAPIDSSLALGFARAGRPGGLPPINLDPRGNGGGGGGGAAPRDPELGRLEALRASVEATGASFAAFAAVRAENPAASDEEIRATLALRQELDGLAEARRRGVIASDQELARLQGLAQANRDAAAATAQRARDLSFVQSVLADAETPQSRYAAQVEALTRLQAQGAITAEAYAAALARAAEARDAPARQAAEAQAAALATAAQAQRAALATPLDRLRAEEERLRRLYTDSQSLPEGQRLTEEELARGLARLRQEYEALARAQAESTVQGQLLRGVLDGQIRTLADLGAALRDVLTDALIEELFSPAETAQGSFVDRLTGRVGARFGVEGLRLPSLGGVGQGGPSWRTPGFGDGLGRGEDDRVQAFARSVTGAARVLDGSFAPGVARAVSEVVFKGAAEKAAATTTGAASAQVARNLLLVAGAAERAAQALASVEAGGGQGEGGGGASFAAFLARLLPGRAGGGGVGGGQWYTVGEQGPERLYVAGQGFVMPNAEFEQLRALSRLGRLGGQGAASAPAAVSVTVVNETGEPVTATATQTRRADGGLDVEIALKRQTAGELATGGFDAELAARYRLKPGNQVRR